MKNLISMTDFVLEQDITNIEQRNSIVNYANFLKKPLTIGMFIPCDENGNILEDPRPMLAMDEINDFEFRLNDFKKAKYRVLFDGFEFKHKDVIKLENYIFSIEDKTIEDLLRIYCFPKLTPTALKQIGL